MTAQPVEVPVNINTNGNEPLVVACVATALEHNTTHIILCATVLLDKERFVSTQLSVAQRQFV